jgi:hypothetical protein
MPSAASQSLEFITVRIILNTFIFHIATMNNNNTELKVATFTAVVSISALLILNCASALSQSIIAFILRIFAN